MNLMADQTVTKTDDYTGNIHSKTSLILGLPWIYTNTHIHILFRNKTMSC